MVYYEENDVVVGIYISPFCTVKLQVQSLKFNQDPFDISLKYLQFSLKTIELFE